MYTLINMKEVFEISKNYSVISYLPYALLLISIFAIVVSKEIAPWAMLAFIIVAINSIDKKNEKLKEDEVVIVKKRLDITLRIFISVSLILLVINNFFVALDTSIVLYILIAIPLTALLILNEK